MTSNADLNKQRIEKIDCDLIIQIANMRFLAHREVLTKRLRFFNKRISTSMLKEKQTVIVLEPEYVIPEVFEHVLQYIYISRIQFSFANLEPIYRIAIYFEFDDLLDAAEKAMRNVYRAKLKSEISIKVFLQSEIRKIVVEHNLLFLENGRQQFVNTYPLLGLDKQRLSYENLKVILNIMNDWKEDMFHLCVEWIRSDQTNRSRRLPELLQLIPLNELSFDFLTETVSNNEFIQNNSENLHLLVEALKNSKSKLVVKSDTQSSSSKSSSIPSSKSTEKSECLYVIGGMDRNTLSSVSKLDFKTNKWTASTPMPTPRTHFGCAVIGRKIYVCGGLTGQSYMNNLTVYDTNTEQWTQLRPMKYARQGCGMAALGGFLYAAGGYDGNELSTVERYSVENDQWDTVTPMISKRKGLQLVAMNDYLYAIDGAGGSILKSVERYSPQTYEWKTGANLRNRYGEFGSAVRNNHIYVADGLTCEVYNPKVDKWNKMPAPSKRTKKGEQLAFFDGKLLLIGGRIGEPKDRKGSKRVERFDFKANAWVQEPDMDVARCYHGVAVVKN